MQPQVLVESVNSDSQSDVDANTFEVEDCGMEDCKDFVSSKSSDQTDDGDCLVISLSVSSDSVSSTAKEPTASAKESTASAKESTAHSIESTAIAKESTASLKESTFRAKESAARSKKSTVKTKESTVKAKKSTARAKKSTVKAKESTVSSDKQDSQLQASTVSVATAQRIIIKQMIGSKTPTNLATPAVKKTVEPGQVSEVVTKLPAQSRRGVSMSKTAIVARQQRQKSKQYLAGLEDSVEKLFKENVLLKKQDTEKTCKIAKLEEEVRYFKQVVANNSMLSSLLQNIHSLNGQKLACSLPPTAAEQDDNCHSAIGEKRKHPKKAFEWDESGPPRTRFSKRPRLLQDLIQNWAGFSSSTVHTALPSDTGDSQETASTKKTPAEVRRDVHANLELEENGGDHNNGKSGDDIGGGTCLHVRGDFVSIELCAACNHKAAKYHHSPFC